jgi:hypothetical protein
MSKRGYYLGGHTVWYARNFGRRDHTHSASIYKSGAAADVHHEVNIGSASATDAFVHDYLRRCQRAREAAEPNKRK